MNFYTLLAVGTLVISLGFALLFYGIALTAGGDPEFIVYLHRSLLIVGGYATIWGGLRWVFGRLQWGD